MSASRPHIRRDLLRLQMAGNGLTKDRAHFWLRVALDLLDEKDAELERFRRAGTGRGRDTPQETP
jgi:hypothetical protein